MSTTTTTTILKKTNEREKPICQEAHQARKKNRTTKKEMKLFMRQRILAQLTNHFLSFRPLQTYHFPISPSFPFSYSSIGSTSIPGKAPSIVLGSSTNSATSPKSNLSNTSTVNCIYS